MWELARNPAKERRLPLPPPFRQPIILTKCSGNLKVHAVLCGTFRQDFAYEIAEKTVVREVEELSDPPGLIRRVTRGIIKRRWRKQRGL
jgi:hypothetical protein